MEIYEKRDDPFDDAFNDVDTSQKSEIQQFYENKTILITGGSGFLGVLLIEKLLRSCSNLKKLILLLREKKGKSVSTRIKEMFENEIFEKMKLQNPRYAKQIELLDGSCDKPNLGLEAAQIKKLQSEVDIIFHSAATVSFDEPIRNIYEVNVAGTRTMLKIAAGTKNLKAFVYVSTAYAQSHMAKIEEKFYPGGISVEELELFVEKFDDRTLNILTPKILNGRFNTYTFTKGIAEELVGKYKSTLPVAVLRPTIVTATFKEPLTGWTNNISGANGVLIASALGFLRTLYCDPDCKAEIIPADIVTNALIVVPKYIQKYWYNSPTVDRSNIEPVFNVAMRQDNLTWGFLMNTAESLSRKQNIITDKILWPYHLSLDRNKLSWLIKYYYLHLLPAPFFVLMERILRQRPRIWMGYIRLYWYTLLYSSFMIHSWTISQENAARLYEDLNPTDKILFNCDANVDWIRYFFYLTKGLGACVVKCDWNDERGRTKLRILQAIDQTLIWSCRGMILALFIKVISALVQRVYLFTT